MPEFTLQIAVPLTTMTISQVFSCSFILSVNLVYIPQGSDGYNCLMGCQFEPRVWKLLLEFFPGPSTLVSLKDPPRQPTPPVKTDSPSRTGDSVQADIFLPVTNSPISSPSGVPGLHLNNLLNQRRNMVVVVRAKMSSSWKMRGPFPLANSCSLPSPIHLKSPLCPRMLPPFPGKLHLRVKSGVLLP